MTLNEALRAAVARRGEALPFVAVITYRSARGSFALGSTREPPPGEEILRLPATTLGWLADAEGDPVEWERRVTRLLEREQSDFGGVA